MRSARYAFELHLFHTSDCPGMTGTCPIKLNDVLTLRQSNFEMLSGALVKPVEIYMYTCNFSVWVLAMSILIVD